MEDQEFPLQNTKKITTEYSEVLVSNKKEILSSVVNAKI
jgi:hypothetical protein